MRPFGKDDDDVEVVPLEIPMDRDTISWLARLARATDTHPSRIVASMIRDIRADDEAAHSTKH